MESQSNYRKYEIAQCILEIFINNENICKGAFIVFSTSILSMPRYTPVHEIISLHTQNLRYYFVTLDLLEHSLIYFWKYFIDSDFVKFE